MNVWVDDTRMCDWITQVCVHVRMGQSLSTLAPAYTHVIYTLHVRMGQSLSTLAPALAMATSFRAITGKLE